MRIIFSIVLSLVLLAAINIINQSNIWTPSDFTAIELAHVPAKTSYRIKDRWRELFETRG